MFNTKNNTAKIHFDHAFIVLRKMSLTSKIRDTLMYEKNLNYLIDRRVEQTLLYLTGFTRNLQNDNKNYDNRQKWTLKVWRGRLLEMYLSKPL